MDPNFAVEELHFVPTEPGAELDAGSYPRTVAFRAKVFDVEHEAPVLYLNGSFAWRGVPPDLTQQEWLKKIGEMLRDRLLADYPLSAP